MIFAESFAEAIWRKAADGIPGAGGDQLQVVIRSVLDKPRGQLQSKRIEPTPAPQSVIDLLPEPPEGPMN